MIKLSHKPADFAPTLKNMEFISTFTDPAEERIEVGVLFVGAGPASLSGAIHLAILLGQKPELNEQLGEVPIAIVEKGKYPGAHLLSGAVVNPIGFQKLFPNMTIDDFPFYNSVEGEAVYYLTKNHAFRFPIIPPTMKNHGNYIASLSEIGKWLGEKAEELGIMILTETSAISLIKEDNSIKGIRTGEKGLSSAGEQLPNYEPGVDISAKITILGEGPLGHLSQTLIEEFDLAPTNPQVYALGVKEIWEVAKPLNKVIHTMGWPLRGAKKYSEFGGSFIYPMAKDKISIGFVVGLDYSDSSLSTHDLLQEFKSHPFIRNILADGNRIENGWGAKTIPEGGYYSLPKKYHVPGALLIGDSAGFVNVPALKGIHYAMLSGIIAAETLYDKIQNEDDKIENLGDFDLVIKNSVIEKDLYKVRNMRQAFKYGFTTGSFLAGLMTITSGLFPGWRFSMHSDRERTMVKGTKEYGKTDNQFTFDKLSSVYASGNRSRDNQPDHLKVNRNVPEVIGETWIQMCPAEVYEWKDNDEGAKTIQTNPTNCVQCGAITAKGGRLTPPEGGSGPEYTDT